MPSLPSHSNGGLLIDNCSELFQLLFNSTRFICYIMMTVIKGYLVIIFKIFLRVVCIIIRCVCGAGDWRQLSGLLRVSPVLLKYFLLPKRQCMERTSSLPSLLLVNQCCLGSGLNPVLMLQVRTLCIFRHGTLIKNNFIQV